MSYKEVKALVTEHKIQSFVQYQLVKKNHPEIPIPFSPNKYYRNEWTGHADFFGKKTFLSYEEAGALLAENGVTTSVAYRAFRKKHTEFPLPAGPNKSYKDKWVCWADFLGKCNRLTLRSLASWLESIDFSLLSDADIYLLITKKPDSVNKGEVSLRPFLQNILRTFDVHLLVRSLKDGAVREIVKSKIASGQNECVPAMQAEESFESDERAEEDCLSLEVFNSSIKLTPEIADTIRHRYMGVSRRIFCSEGRAAVEAKLTASQTEIGKSIVQQIRAEMDGADSIDTSCWRLMINGKETEPTNMQRLCAYLVSTQKYTGNWSGTGSGKTGAAALSAIACHAGTTVVLANNSTVRQWERSLKAILGLSASETFRVINYEKFQTRNASALVASISTLKPGLLVFDEIQMMKRRKQNSASRRRTHLLELVARCPKAKVLAMTATPVINELKEGYSVLSLDGNTEERRNIRPTIHEALMLQSALVKNGIRFRPQYDMTLRVRKIPAPIAAKLSFDSSSTADRTILGIERSLISAKLNTVRNEICPGSVIYSYYTDGTRMLEQAAEYVRSLGFSSAIYGNGSRRREKVKEDFLAGKIDVLIGSSVIGTGVDGLQTRCNRMIVLSLPWTHAAFEQMQGRIYRTGSTFRNAEIIIPQVPIDGVEESWDEARYSVIEGKRTLVECAVDGILPNSMSFNKQKFLDEFKKRFASQKTHDRARRHWRRGGAIPEHIAGFKRGVDPLIRIVNGGEAN